MTECVDYVTDPDWQKNWILQHRIQKSGIPLRFHEGFQTYEPRTPESSILREIAFNWAERFNPVTTEKGLALTGPTGCGKSHLAAAIARRVVERGYGVLWKNVGDLFSEIRATWGAHDDSEWEMMKQLSTVDLLVLDDLGIENDQMWVLERLYLFLNARHENCHVVVFTSNYSGKELIERMNQPDPKTGATSDLGDRIISRLVGMVDGMAGFPNVDFRRTISKAAKGE